MKIRHLLKSGEFADVFKNGRKIKGESISLYFKEEKNDPELYIGIVVAKKIIPLAVTRNYFRRLVYAYFRDSYKGNGGFRIIVRAEKRPEKKEKKPFSKKTRQELDILVEKAGIKP